MLSNVTSPEAELTSSAPKEPRPRTSADAVESSTSAPGGEAIRGSAGLRLLDALGEAALEISAQLPSGHVEVRLSGQDPVFVYVGEEEAPPEPAVEDGLAARITLRLPEALKASVEAAAAREGVSVNSWLVRALSGSVAGPVQKSGKRLRGFAQS